MFMLLCIYVWLFQMYGLIGLFCVFVDYCVFGDGCIIVWFGMQNFVLLCYDFVMFVVCDEVDVDIVWMEVVGCYGCNGVDDVCGDVLLLLCVVGCLVCV